MKIHYRVQHAPGRDIGLERLLPLLPSHADVVTDVAEGKRSPCRGYLKCLQTATTENATHLLVVQDDALPCKGFASELERAVSERPDDMLSLFVGGLPGRTRRDFLAALGDGSRWTPVYFREIHHVVALVWPTPLLHEFLAWYPATRIPIPVPHESDDAVIGFWARTQKKLFWATVPCLVEHPDDLPSVVQGNRKLGDKGRRAIAFLDDL